MCLICIEFERQRMTVVEAWRALGEMRPSLEAEHVRELEARLIEAAVPVRKQAEPQPDCRDDD